MSAGRCVTVALTGGACGGKTALTHELRVRPPWNVPIFVIPEAGTKLWRGLPVALAETERGRLIAAERLLLRSHRADVDQAWELASVLDTPGPALVVCDRAELDLDAYIGAETVDGLLSEIGSSRDEVLARYELVLHLVTVADGAPEHFYDTPPGEREEWLRTAIEIDRACATSWRGHPSYRRLGNETGWKEKLHLALKLLEERLLPG